ncbi:MAG TPA: heme peroxidase family protein [Methylomirabilota bacterium]
MSARSAAAIVALAALVTITSAVPSHPAAQPRGRGYGYLFPALQARSECFLPYAADGGLDPAIQDLLKALAHEIDAPSPAEGESSIPAGFTYLGQFIIHDLSFDGTPSVTRPIDVAALENLRTPALDLDSLYGRGPLDQPYLYERVVRSDLAGPRLLAGHRLNAADLPRDTAGRITGRALIGDPRNDDNLIVSQLHLAFIAFHNAVVDRLAPRITDRARLFQAARAEVTRHYQWIVLHEYLPTIADPAVVAAVLATPCNEFCDRGVYMPVEFSMAGFRFGHSMVRPSYAIRDAKTATFDQMRNEFTFRNPLVAGVAPGWEVDWRRFFWTGARPENANRAMKIGTHVVTGLPTKISLLKAYAARIPSGQCVAGALGVPSLTSEQLLAGNGASVLRQHDGLLLERAPLWYYVLKEAEAFESGGRLGPLGSRLVTEVLVNLVRAERGSILDVPGWRPTLGTRRGNFHMLDLLCVGGSLSPCPK